MSCLALACQSTIEGSLKQGTHRHIQKVPPGEIVPIEIELLPSSTFFEAGSTLQLIIQGQELLNYRGFGHDELVNRGMHRISTGGPYDSYLLVSSVES